VAPIGPVAPISPVSPLGPVAPVGPVAPIGPVAPVGPVAPTKLAKLAGVKVSLLIENSVPFNNNPKPAV
jgi:hypothetical protein